VISVDLARALRTAGLPWDPATGDWFVVDAEELLDDRLVLSTLTVDVHRYATGTVLGFNGTTEWALDSVAVSDTLWLPTEDQLRDRLGEAFTRLDRPAGSWRVELSVEGSAISFVSPGAADAYGRALLHLLTR